MESRAGPLGRREDTYGTVCKSLCTEHANILFAMMITGQGKEIGGMEGGYICNVCMFIGYA